MSWADLITVARATQRYSPEGKGSNRICNKMREADTFEEFYAGARTKPNSTQVPMYIQLNKHVAELLYHGVKKNEFPAEITSASDLISAAIISLFCNLQPTLSSERGEPHENYGSINTSSSDVVSSEGILSEVHPNLDGGIGVGEEVSTS